MRVATVLFNLVDLHPKAECSGTNHIPKSADCYINKCFHHREWQDTEQSRCLLISETGRYQQASLLLTCVILLADPAYGV